MLDGYAVQVLTLFIYVFILIYFESFKWGLKILRFFERVGKAWLMQVVCIFIFLIASRLISESIHRTVLILIVLTLFLSIVHLHEFSLKFILKKQ
jgi:hypothetical protein